MSNNKIVYLRWGERYTQEHVDRLFDRVNNNCSIDFDFITMDVSSGKAFEKMQALQKKYYRGNGDPESSITENPFEIYKREDAGGMAHFRKYIMFLRDEEYDDDDVFLYLDLDTLIQGDLAYFFDLNVKKPYILRSWEFNNDSMWKRLYNLRCAPYFNSSVMLWKKGQNRKIFNELTNETYIDANFFTYGVNDNWLFHRFGPHTYNNNHKNWFNFFNKGVIISEDPTLENKNTIIKTLAGMSMSEKNKLCLN